MKKVLITLLFILLNFNYSYSDIYKKITVEEVEDIFFNKLKWDGQNNNNLKKNLKIDTYKKRLEARGIAKCMYNNNIVDKDQQMLCKAELIRTILTASDRGKVKRPGDIFYVFDAIDKLIHDPKNKNKYIKRVSRSTKEKPLPGMVCEESYCYTFEKNTLKKLEKLKDDPANEKVLGSSLIKYIKTVRMIFEIRETIGSRDFPLLGDMMNLSVHRKQKKWKKDFFIKNKKSPDLKKRKKLLSKYSLRLYALEKKIREDNYKSIDKDISKLSKIYEDLNKLPKSNDSTRIHTNQFMTGIKSAYEISNFIDEAIDISYDFNKFLKIVSSGIKNNKKDKLLALNSIKVMKSLINSILSTIPDRYIAGRGLIDKDLFNEYERKELGIIAKSLQKNKLIKCNELKKSLSVIDTSFNSKNMLVKFYNLEKEKNIVIKNKTCGSTISSTNTKNINLLMSEVDIKAEISKIINMDFNFINLDMNILNDVRDSASNLASEITTNQANNSTLSKAIKSETGSGSVLDKKFGEVTLKQLIAIGKVNP